MKTILLKMAPVIAILFIISLIVRYFVAPAFSAPKHCYTKAWLTAEVARVVMGSVIATMDRDFLDRLNAAPPKSDFRADQIVTAVHPVSDRVLVALFVKGCLNESLVIKRDVFFRLIDADLGRDI